MAPAAILLKVAILAVPKAILLRVAIPVARRVIPNRARLVLIWAWLEQLRQLPQAGPAAVAKAAIRANSVLAVANPRKSPRLAGLAPAVTAAIPANSVLNAASPNRQQLLQAGPAPAAL